MVDDGRVRCFTMITLSEVRHGVLLDGDALQGRRAYVRVRAAVPGVRTPRWILSRKGMVDFPEGFDA